MGSLRGACKTPGVGGAEGCYEGFFTNSRGSRRLETPYIYEKLTIKSSKISVYEQGGLGCFLRGLGLRHWGAINPLFILWLLFVQFSFRLMFWKGLLDSLGACQSGAYGGDMSQVVESVENQEGAVIAGNVLRSSRLKNPCTDAPRPIDLVHLSKFTLGNRELEAELLGLFKSQSHIYLDRMKLAETEEEWVRAAHSLKGSARAVGAWIVGDISERAEQTTCDTSSERHALVGDVRREVDLTNRYIEDLFAE